MELWEETENIRDYLKCEKWFEDSYGKKKSFVWYIMSKNIIWSRVYGGWDKSKEVEYLVDLRRKYFYFLGFKI